VGYNLLDHKRNENRTTNTTNNRIYTAMWKELETTQQQTELWQESKVQLKISYKRKEKFEKILFHMTNVQHVKRRHGGRAPITHIDMVLRHRGTG
jgi:hypothetical protein